MPLGDVPFSQATEANFARAEVISRESGVPVDAILPMLADAAVEFEATGLIRQPVPDALV